MVEVFVFCLVSFVGVVGVFYVGSVESFVLSWIGDFGRRVVFDEWRSVM